MAVLFLYLYHALRTLLYFVPYNFGTSTYPAAACHHMRFGLTIYALYEDDMEF